MTDLIHQERVWHLPISQPHRLARRAGKFCFVGGAGDLDSAGQTVHSGDLLAQVDGAVGNLQSALLAQGCDLEDVVRLKAYFRSKSDDDEGWTLLAELQDCFKLSPAPVISMQPNVMMPWAGQEVQLQAIAVKGWREQRPVEFVTAATPMEATAGPVECTVGLRAGDFFAVTDIPGYRDGFEGGSIAETDYVMDRLDGIMRGLDVSFSDTIKKEGYYLGTSMSDWEPMAAARARRFPPSSGVATVVPWRKPWPRNVTTRVELLGYRAQLGDHSKPVGRVDSWPDWVWDWPIREVPFRQGQSVGDCIWVGGQVPWGAGRTMNLQSPGNLRRQVDFTLGTIGDILGGFNRRLDDLAMLVCYFESDGTAECSRQLLERVAANIPGALPPITLVPQPSMHYPEMKTEIWGVACG